MSIFSSIAKGLKNLTFSCPIDDGYFEDLEEQLIMADVGVETSGRIVERLREQAKRDRLKDASQLRPVIERVVCELLSIPSPTTPTDNPRVILVTGVNGVGKTTTIGKLSARFAEQGKTVLLAAADTFRAAAIEQLTIWAQRTGAQIVAHSQGSDPAAVVHDAIAAGKARDVDVIICDTAGRLHNKKNLMDELSKIRRVIQKELPSCVPQSLLVVDATTGQNALIQAKQFKAAAGVDSVALTKLDGTAKGGVVIAIAGEAGIPVKYIGMGEQAEDLFEFDPKQFSHDLFSGE